MEHKQSTILVVEDETKWHRTLKNLLQPEGFNIVSAFDYGDALKQLEQLQPPPELAIVDLRLPSSGLPHADDGYHVLTALRNKGSYAIVLSGFLDGVVESLAKRPEVEAVVDKLRFTDDGFTEYFLAKVHAAVTHADDARRAEGKLLEQQERLRHLPLPPHN